MGSSQCCVNSSKNSDNDKEVTTEFKCKKSNNKLLDDKLDFESYFNTKNNHNNDDTKDITCLKHLPPEDTITTIIENPMVKANTIKYDNIRENQHEKESNDGSFIRQNIFELNTSCNLPLKTSKTYVNIKNKNLYLRDKNPSNSRSKFILHKIR